MVNPIRMTRASRWFAAIGMALTAGLVLIAAGWLSQPGWLTMPLATRSDGVDVLARRAETTMRTACDVIRSAKRQDGLLTSAEAAGDPSGLLGAEMTPLVTTLGSLEAKRLSTLPGWASALTAQLHDAGVGKGSTVAASFSGSFPALNLAVVAACETLGARLVAVSSVTASTWGANQPGFTWPELEARLVSRGVIHQVSVAVSMGGDSDRARDLDADGQSLAEAIARRSAEALHATLLLPGR